MLGLRYRLDDVGRHVSAVRTTKTFDTITSAAWLWSTLLGKIAISVAIIAVVFLGMMEVYGQSTLPLAIKSLLNSSTFTRACDADPFFGGVSCTLSENLVLFEGL